METIKKFPSQSSVYGFSLKTLLTLCMGEGWCLASTTDQKSVLVIAGVKTPVASIVPGGTVAAVRKGHKASQMVGAWVAELIEQHKLNMLVEKGKKSMVTVVKEVRQVEVNRPVNRLLNASSVALFSPSWSKEEMWEHLSNTCLHKLIPGEEDVELVFRTSTVSVAPLPKLRAPRASTITSVDEYGVAEDHQVLEMDALSSALDNLMAAAQKGAIRASHYDKIEKLLDEALKQHGTKSLLKADTKPGLQAPAICGDGIVLPGELGIDKVDAIAMAYEICGVHSQNKSSIALPPNTKAVRKELMQRVKLQNGELYTQLSNAFQEVDKKAYGAIVTENIDFLVEMMNRMPLWPIRFPCTSVPIMRLRVIENAPGRAIFITTEDMKFLFNGDFDGDFLYFTLVGKMKKGKSQLEMVNTMIKREFAPSLVWVDSLTPQPGQIQHDFHYDLRLRLKSKFKVMGKEITLDLLKDEGINGNTIDNPILAKLEVMVGFEQRNWVGILTWLAWQLYWVVVNEIGAPTPEKQMLLEAEMARIADGSESGLPSSMQRLLDGVTNSGGEYKGTTRRIWAEKSFGVVIWLLESCFDARKLSDPRLASELAVSIVNCLMGATGVPADIIREAYAQMDRTEKEITECIDLLQSVIDFQDLGGLMDLKHVTRGTGQSLTWEKWVTQRSNPQSMRKFRQELNSMGLKNPYQFMIDELSFEKIYARRITPQEPKEVVPLQAFLMADLPDPGKDVHISRFVRPETSVRDGMNASAELIKSKILELAERASEDCPELMEEYNPKQFRIKEYSNQGEIVRYLEKAYYPQNSKGQPMLDKNNKPVVRVIRVRLPKVSMLQQSYREGNPPAVLQKTEAQEGRFLYRPVLTNAHFGTLPECVINDPLGAANHICSDHNGASPWFIRTFEDTYARAVFAAYQQINLRQASKEAYAATENQLRAWVQGSVKTELEVLERYTRADQLRVIGEEAALDFNFNPGRVPQTTEQAIKGVMWSLLLNMGYDTVCTSKSQNGTVACWKGERHSPLWMAGVHPMAAASREQRLLRELRSVLKQWLYFSHEDAGRQRIVNKIHALPVEFKSGIMEMLVCYANTTQTTLLEGKKVNKKGEIILDENGREISEIMSLDQGKTFPAGIDRLNAYEMKVAVIEPMHRSEEELQAEIAKYPDGKVEEVWQTTAAGMKRVLRIPYQDLRPGNGIFKVTFVENVVKFMTIPTTVQWWAKIGGVMVALHMLASAQSAFDKDGQVGILRAAMSLVSSYEQPWELEDNMSIEALNGLIPEVEAKLKEAGIFDSNGNINGRVPVYSDPKGENYVGDYTVGWQTVVRTPHDDKTSTKVKGIKQDPHVRHLGDIPIFYNKRDEQQMARIMNFANIMADKKSRISNIPVDQTVEYDDVNEFDAMLDDYEGMDCIDEEGEIADETY